MTTQRSFPFGSLACCSYVMALILPIMGLIGSWIGWGWKAGLLTGLGIFGFFFLFGSMALVFMPRPEWFTALLPLAAGWTYVLLPDFIPGPFDDVAVFSAAAIISFIIAARRYGSMPGWMVTPLLAAAVYVPIGGFIPGPVDELFVGIIAGTYILNQVRKRRLPSESTTPAALPESEVQPGSHH